MSLNGGNITTTAIITNGLFCSPIEQSGIITAFFSLYVSAQPPSHENSGGGGYPREAWNKIPDIQNFYKPYFEDEWQYKQLKDYTSRKKKLVVLTVNVGETSHQKEFLVDEKYANTIVSVSEIINTTKLKAKVQIDNISSYVAKITAKINKIKVRIPRN